MNPNAPSLLAEQALIGAAILDSTTVLGHARLAGINRESFTVERHRILWDCLQDLETSPRRIPGRSNVDHVTVPEWLRCRHLLDLVGGSAYLSTITDVTPTSDNAGHYIDIIQDLHQRARLRQMALEIQAMTNDPEQDPHGICSKAIQRMTSLVQRREQQPSQEKMREILSAWQVVKDAQQAGLPRQYLGLPMGFPGLDDILSGLQPGLNIVAGLPSAGKTAFACHAMLNIARRGLPCAAVLMDISERRTRGRLVANHAGVSLAKINKGRVYGEQWDKVITSADDIGNLPIEYLENEDDLDNVCAFLRLQKASRNIQFFMVDYLQLLSPHELRRENEQEQLKYVTRRLKKLSLELQLPGLVLAQFNRDSQKENRPPRLSDLHGASAIEKESTTAVLIYEWRQYPYPSDPEHEFSQKKRRAVVVEVAKQQDGETGQFPFWLRAPYFKFEQADERWGLSVAEFNERTKAQKK